MSVRRNNNKSRHNVVKIPKIIMQTWKNNEVPDKWVESPKSIREYMPDWKYVLMTDEMNRKFVEKHFPDFLPYYDAFPYNIQRADAIRYCWLYINGGMYLDLDIQLQHDLSSLFYDEAKLYLVASGNIGSCITNSFMASKPKCKIWLRMIEYMKRDLSFYHVFKHSTVMASTGPVALNHVVKSSDVSYINLPTSLMMPCSVCDLAHCDSSQAWIKPLEGSSWISYDSQVLNMCMCNWRAILVIIALVIIVLVVIFILWYFDLWKRK